jgi:hypothetical protein
MKKMRTSTVGPQNHSFSTVARTRRSRAKFDGRLVETRAFPRQGFGCATWPLGSFVDVSDVAQRCKIASHISQFFSSTTVGGPAAVERGATSSILPDDWSRRKVFASTTDSSGATDASSWRPAWW